MGLRGTGGPDDLAKRVDAALDGGLVSDAAFRAALEQLLSGAEAAAYAFRITITGKDGVQVASYEVNGPRTGSAGYSRELLGATDAVRCRCEIWTVAPRTAGADDPNDLAGLIEEMVRRHWGSRDPHTLLPYLKTAGMPERFAATARNLGSSPVAVLHTDLDKFKAINTDFSETGGDAVLAEFARRFRLAFAELGVTVRTGGDEFSAILSLADPLATMQAVEGFRAEMERDPFPTIGRTNTCSIGLCLYEDANRFADAAHHDPILVDARSAEVRAKTEGRNRICLSGPTPDVATGGLVVDADTLLQTGLAARCMRRAEPRTTSDAVEAAIRARLASELGRSASIATAIDKVRNGLGLLIGLYEPPTGKPAMLAGIIDSLKWAEMVTSAVFEAGFAGAGPLGPDDTVDLTLAADGAMAIEASGTHVALGGSVRVDQSHRACLGRVFRSADGAPHGAVTRLADVVASTAGDPWSPVLLLPIGDDAKIVADGLTSVVAAVVDIDDRPARGGGLPDFWQSNLSRVIRAVLANPNITSVLAIGDEAYAGQTLSRLRAGDGLDLDELQRRLSMSSADLSAFRARRVSVAVVPSDRSEALREIGAAIRGLQPLDFGSRPVVDQLRRSKRRLPIAAASRHNRLDVLDGLRTRTLADAYPEALQLVRGANDPDDHQEPRRGLFREMTGFKIVLTDPLAERVPDYWKEENGTFERYYADSFVDPAGPFGKRLNGMWQGGTRTLLEFATSQTADAAVKGVPTRRINLPIVPDELEHPLGLSSVQVMPRAHDGVDTLDMIFVWRTVDALVGFPFSAYGSIRWSEDFLASVNQKVKATPGSRALRLGSVTYIALSFHMYLHDGDVEIARTIVQDASF